ncbi:hypothetical protein WA158_008230 [Blastocystis sp. Blastoise]
MYELFGDQGVDAIHEGMISIRQVFINMNIIDRGYFETPLVNWLGKEKKWKLLFRASEHNYSSLEFHKYCDDKGETVILIKNQSWSSDTSWGDWKSYSKEFVFTLSNEYNIPPTKYEYTSSNTRHGIYCHASHGPVFGFNDITIDGLRSNPGNYCKSVSFATTDTPQKSSLFVNDCYYFQEQNNFEIEEYEVWGRL